MRKKRIVVGVRMMLDKTAEPSSVVVSEKIPIYEEWTPELQERQDDMYRRCAEVFTNDLLEYSRTGGDMTNLTVKGVYSHLKNYKRELKQRTDIERKIKEKEVVVKEFKEIVKEETINIDVSKSDYQEFLNWKKKISINDK